MLKDGVILMVMGMGTVFVFLIIMIIAMNITAIIMKKTEKYFPEPVSVKQSTLNNSNESAIAVAIAIARFGR